MRRLLIVSGTISLGFWAVGAYIYWEIDQALKRVVR